MFKDILKKERLRLGLTQEQLGKKLNISRSNVANWENGSNNASPEMILKCSEIFNCSTDYLMGKTEYRTPFDEFDAKMDLTKIKNEVKILDNLPTKLKKELEINEIYKTIDNENYISNGQLVLDILKNLNFVPIDREITDGEIKDIINLFKNINELIEDKELIDISDLNEKDREQIKYMLDLMRKNQDIIKESSEEK